MGGGVPANTTTTTTVNQSPWQNPTYQALMLGTKDKPGPITNILRSNQGYMDAYNQMLGQGITPADIVNSGKYNPTAGGAGTSFQPTASTQAAASGGIMNVRGYAGGGAPKIPKNATAEQRLSAIQSAVENGYKPKPADTRFMQTMADTQETIKGLGDTPYSVDPKTGALKPVGRASNQSSASYTDYLNKFAGAGGTLDPKLAKQYGAQTAAQQQTAAADARTNTARQDILKQSMGQTAFTRVNDAGQLESTNPLFNQAVSRVQEAQKLPEQFGLATDAYKTGLAGLGDAAKYQAQNVTGKDVSAAQINRGDVRDINAIMADVERYQAAGMQAPPALQAEAYKAAQMKGAQMQGPKSWTDPGVAQQYMNPYQQAVVDQEKFESNRNFLQNLNALRGGAAKSKAYGGTRQAMQEAEALRNQGYTLADIQNKGSSQAYQQGMQQFATEQGQGLQAGQANLQANLTTQQQNQAALNNQRSLYVQQALDAAKTSYGGELTAAQQNQIAQNAAAQFNAQSQNTAYNNYSAQQLAAQQSNQSMDWNVANQNAQLAQQAALANQLYGVGGFNAQTANQQAGLQANQQNIGAYGQYLQGAQGLGALGASQASTNLANIGALGQAASAWQNLGQQYLNTQTQNAQNAINFPSNLYGPAVNMINSQSAIGGNSTQFGTSSPASWMGGKAEGGEVEAHKEWDKAKGGTTVKKGIASRGWN